MKNFNIGDIVISSYRLANITFMETYEVIDVVGDNRILIVDNRGISELYFNFYFNLDFTETRNNKINEILK